MSLVAQRVWHFYLSNVDCFRQVKFGPPRLEGDFVDSGFVTILLTTVTQK